ncbi:hypothetical protein [Rhodoblastus sp.]|uniref:hypothetical protein n=1 Tax=Rhodoblastus sp. TaxID=1962975 RepID=UPI003F9BC50F
MFSVIKAQLSRGFCRNAQHRTPQAADVTATIGFRDQHQDLGEQISAENALYDVNFNDESHLGFLDYLALTLVDIRRIAPPLSVAAAQNDSITPLAFASDSSEAKAPRRPARILSVLFKGQSYNPASGGMSLRHLNRRYSKTIRSTKLSPPP